MKQTISILGLAVLFAVFSSASSAQTFTDQQKRSAYAGAYFSLSFGGGEKAYKRPVRYGFSAGFRQSNFGASSHYYSPQFDRRDANINLRGGNDWQARVVDLNFSDRGFEHLSLSGVAFAQKDAFGQVQYFGGRGLYADEDEKGSNVGKILLWTAAGVGAAFLAFAAICASEGGEDQSCFTENS